MIARRAGAVALDGLTGDDGLVEADVVPGTAGAGRVTMEVVVRNLGRRPISVTNPYDGLTYHLIDTAGNPIQVAEPPSSAKVHAPPDPARRRQYLELTAATVGGTSMAADELIGAREVDLAPGAELELSLAVTASIDPADQTLRDEVPSGDYQLVVMLRMVVEDADGRHPVLLRTAEDIAIAVT